MSSGREQRIAKRYAKALFDVCAPADLDRVEAQLKALAQAWATSTDFRESMSNPRVAEGSRLAVIAAVADAFGGFATEPLKRTLTTLTSLRKASVIPALSEIFSHFVSEYKKSLLLEVTLAQPANEGAIAELQKKLSSSLGGEVKMTVKTDPSLIGGLTVRLGDSFLDRSVAGTLQRVAAQLVR
jgi:F-type H+-transporting ATPase subunit delta